MRLSPGDRLGPFEIAAPIGRGGMGAVYRARDTRLGRDVAIKVSAEQFSERFEREARAVAQLNHPHICTLHDVGPNYLVMELVEGETLAMRLKKGALPLDQVLRYGGQIADALAAAHAKGIIHRDLKPGNIMLSQGGIKVLDFGLAKAPEDETITATNAVMGTPAYMAPEQRAGKECDARTDIFALGLILYETATGQRAIHGPIPRMEQLPEGLAHVIARCLAADPAERWQTASDVKHELAWRPRESAVPAASRPKAWLWIAAGLLAGAGLVWSIEHFGRTRDEPRPMRLAINPPPEAELRGNFAISPDGRLLVFSAHFAGRDALWLRALNSQAARELPGTEGAAEPFWSPDSGSIAFFVAGKLKRVEVNGGSPTVICDVGQGRGGSWSTTGTIIFNSVNDGPILRVPAVGGTPVPVTQVDTVHQENSHRWPFFLPDGRHFLYYVRSANLGSGPGGQGVYISSIDKPQEKALLISSQTNAVYSSSEAGGSSYLLWVKEENLMAQRFDAGSVRLLGEAAPVAERVDFSIPGRFANLSVSNDGTLVYRGASARLYQLTWMDRSGRPTGTIGAPDSYQGVRISPDGTRIAVTRIVHGISNLALIEAARGIATPLASDIFGDVWSPDGEMVAYSTSPGGSPNIYSQPVRGRGERERLTNSHSSQDVHDWSSDGRFLLYEENVNDPSAPAGSDLWILPLTGNRQPFPYLQTPWRETASQFSPDGRWIAYTSDEQGLDEIYVQSFPVGRGKWQISSHGGDYPRWRRDGKELYYVGPDGGLKAVTVRSSPAGLDFGAPVSLFRIAVPPRNGPAYPFDIAPDGRFLMLAPAAEQGDSALMVALHWQSQLHQ